MCSPLRDALRRRLIYLVSLVVVLSMALTSTTKAELVGWWRFDEGSGTIANDSSGNGNDGQINGTQWVEGKASAFALEFNSTIDDYVWIGEYGLLPDKTITVAVWAYARSGPNWASMVKNWGGATTGGFHLGLGQGEAGRLDVHITQSGGGTVNVNHAELFPLDDWHHCAFTADGSKVRLYLDGEEVASGDYDGTLRTSFPFLAIGVKPDDTGGVTGGWGFWDGFMDDVRIYDHALTEVEILGAMTGEPWPYAFGPDPADGALHSDTWASISWRAGDYAVSHDVYFGDNFDDVNNGAEGTFLGNQADTFFVAGFPGFPYPDGLVPGTTYYWRIDEVNDTEPNSPWKGDVWSFSIPPKTAYNPDPADDAESVDPNANLIWTAGFGAKLHTVYFGDNFEEVNNATEGLAQGTTTYTPGTLELAKTYYWRVDEFDAFGTHKGNIWSFTTEGAVGSPEPAKGAVDITQTPVLTWVPGVYGASHEIYFGTDKEAVKNADTSSPEFKGTGNLGAESYDAGNLEWDTTYYWRIDEANNANTDSPWTGPVWSFTTANFLVVDDFESYNDLDPDDPNSNRIFNAWLDGYDDPTNGSTVGHLDPPFAEQTIVHGGLQSMPFVFDNAVGKSEATLTLTYPRDWTVNGVNTLTIWLRGDATNATEPLYVVLNGSAVVTNDNPDAAQESAWTEWNIDLQAFADQGVNLANVNTITLGLGNRNNPVAGGAGMMFFDDIRLYAPEPAP